MQRILLIEDNDEIRENTVEILELANYKVDAANNGKVGVTKALENTPDLIICDVMMPEIDGYGVLHLIQKNENLKLIPFIFLTAKAERGDFRKGMEMGADDYITKPFSEIELLTAIERRINKANYWKVILGDAFTQHKPYDSDSILALQSLIENSEFNFYKKKQIIYSEGNHPFRIFFIQKGKVKTFKTNDDGKDLTIALYGEGDYFGYTAILEGTVYKENAETIEESTLAVMGKDEFKKILEDNKNVSQQFIKLLAHSVTEREKQLIGIAYNSLRKRVAETLVLIEGKYNTNKIENFSIHISREDLAHIAGTANESIIRTLSDFKSEKLIDIKERSIVILDLKKLSLLPN
jgi:DNA-binding response OmpR family regulator